MALETGSYISDLVPANPGPGDLKSQGDDHIRLVKSALKNTFPNITGFTTVSQTDLTNIAGLTGSVQAQINAKGAIAGQVWAGTHDYTAGTLRAFTRLPNDNSSAVATTAYTDAAALAAVAATAAPTNSPNFTGTPTVPTAPAGTSTNQIATTAYVNNYVVAAGAVPAQPGGTSVFYLSSVAGTASWAALRQGRNYFTAAQ